MCGVSSTPSTNNSHSCCTILSWHLCIYYVQLISFFSLLVCLPLSVCLSASVCLSVFVCQSDSVCVSVSVCLSLSFFIRAVIVRQVWLNLNCTFWKGLISSSLCVPLYLSVCLSFNLSVYLFVYLCLSCEITSLFFLFIFYCTGVVFSFLVLICSYCEVYQTIMNNSAQHICYRSSSEKQTK